MKPAFRLYRRNNGVFYLQNNSTGEQRSLKTKDEEFAKELFRIENAQRKDAAVNMELGRVYIRNADPLMAERTWQVVMDELSSHGKESSRTRCRREMQSKPFNIIRDKRLIETTGEDLKAVLKRGGSATNNYLRRLHNLALGNGWIHWAIIPPKQWEKPSRAAKRAITLEEHTAITRAEKHEERRKYYQTLWLLGAAQTDCSLLSSDNVNWETRVLSYRRGKTQQWAHLSIGPSLEALLRELPAEGLLFPYMAGLSDKDRAAEFARRCRILGIKGVSLHSYRYAWAERAYAAGYGERYAQAALGHKSRAVHHAYARGAQVVCPPLENVVPFKADAQTSVTQETSLEQLKVGGASHS